MRKKPQVMGFAVSLDVCTSARNACVAGTLILGSSIRCALAARFKGICLPRGLLEFW
jgi:hypothetical protein